VFLILNLLLLWWQSWFFSIIPSVFSITWSFRNQCWFSAQETFLITISNV